MCLMCVLVTSPVLPSQAVAHNNGINCHLCFYALLKLCLTMLKFDLNTGVRSGMQDIQRN